MMMNERVEIGGRGGKAEALNEQLVTLHRRLKRIAKARAYLDVKEAEALREAQRLALWKQFGYTSLADYMTNELGYTYRAAEDRLRLANALPELPKLTEALQTGNLNFSQARELARVATPETEDKWIEKAKDLSVREVEQAVAGHCKGSLPDDAPDPRLVRKTLWLSVRPETDVLFREVRAKLEKERGEKLDEDAVLEAMCRVVLAARAPQERAPQRGAAPGTEPRAASIAEPASANAPAPAAAPAAGPAAAPAAASAAAPAAAPAAGQAAALAAAPAVAAGSAYRIAVTVCRDCKRGWRHGAGAIEEMSPPALETATCDAQWIGDVGSDAVERAHEAIAPATRRKVLHRDQNRCRVPGCHAHTNLDIHHIVHREHGGTNDLTNLITLCEAHHLAHHDGTLAIVRRATGEIEMRREGRNNFTRAAREVETREALRRRGFGRDAIKAIMTQLVTHVGVSSISAEQWLALALRYAEQLGLSS